MPRPRSKPDDGDRRSPPLRPGMVDRDLVREYKCFMCGREAPKDDPLPLHCPTCGGNWLVVEDYVPRYG
jgi:DNA-directed RNA polymerase subunit RPC12/RpoP